MVWIQIIGQRKFESLDKEQQKKKTFSQRWKLAWLFYQILIFILIIILKTGNLLKQKQLIFFEYQLSDQQHQTHSIRIIFSNPSFIDFSGPFEFFASWHKFAVDYTKSTERWREIFRSFSRAYAITKLIYFSEIFFPLKNIYDGKKDFEEFLRPLVNETSIKRDELFGLENFHHYYIEKI